MYNRRKFIRDSTLTTGAFIVSKYGIGQVSEFPEVRIPLSERRFSSPIIEQVIRQVQADAGNQELGWLFGNCFPNTLDTTVDFSYQNGKPDTYVITGDIDAMWLRDSTAQVWPYLPLMREDKKLQDLIKGVVNRQTKCILLDPYANAFFKDDTQVSEWKDDHTQMKPGIHERKWEIDSLCYAIRLAHGYWQRTGDTGVFDKDWQQAMRLVIQTFKEQQRFDGKGPYSFMRTTAWATDGVPLAGYGYPVKPNGLIVSIFRPSDDATIFPYLIPSNLFAVKALDQLLEIQQKTGIVAVPQATVQALRTQVAKAIEQYAIHQHPRYGAMYAFEVNGYGSFNLMDDANVPSLLSIPYLGAEAPDSPIYHSTRNYVLSPDNPFYFSGTAAEGVGSPHTGMDMIWPMSITMRALTSNDNREIKHCLEMLQGTHAGTGFMHESFHKDNPANFTRKWFAWANTLFGEMILKVHRERRFLLNG